MANSSQTQASGHGIAHGHGTASVAALALGAIGVVFGDIGTSPLYTLKEAFGRRNVSHWGTKSRTHPRVRSGT